MGTARAICVHFAGRVCIARQPGYDVSGLGGGSASGGPGWPLRRYRWSTGGGGVSKVEFFVDGSRIGTDTSSTGGWTLAWNTTTATTGRHTLTATATSVSGSTATSPGVSVAVDQLPTIDITAPRAGAVVRERVTVTATATDDLDVDQVEFFADGASLGVDTSSVGGWRLTWNTRAPTTGVALSALW